MPSISSTIAFLVSLLFRLVQAGRPWRPAASANVQQDAQLRRPSTSPGLAAVAMPVPLAAPMPGLVANMVAQQLPVLVDPSGWGDYVGRFASAAFVASAGAMGASRNRRRRRGGGAAQLAAVAQQRRGEVVPLVEAATGYDGVNAGLASGAALPNEVAEMRHALQTMQTMQPQVYQPPVQFVAVGWAPVFFPVGVQDGTIYEFIPGQELAFPPNFSGGDASIFPTLSEEGGYDFSPSHELFPPTAAAVDVVAGLPPENYPAITKAEASKVVKELSLERSSSEWRKTLDWVIESAWPLANSNDGSRVVQKAFEVANFTDQALLREALQGHVMEAVTSPHANHVLQKCIEVTPASHLSFVTDELRGNAAVAAKHRFGCRILERLIEHHCAVLPTEALMDEIVAETSSLCRHSFANFVVQHVLEHGSLEQKARICEVLLSEVCRLAKHRVASHVVQCALVYASPEDRERLKQAMSSDAAELEDIRKTQCGRFVVDEMNRV